MKLNANACTVCGHMRINHDREGCLMCIPNNADHKVGRTRRSWK